MKQLFNKWISAAGMAAGLMLAASPAHAVYTIAMVETSGNVVATGGGTINTAGLADIGAAGCTLIIVNPSSAHLCIGGDAFREYSGASGPSSFGAGGDTGATGVSAGFIGLNGNNVLIVSGYVSGPSTSTASTWNGFTFATLGVTPGTYTWTFGTGANADSIVLQIGAVTPPVTPPPPPIPANVVVPGVPGIASQLSVLDLSSGSGPSMTTCLANAVKQVFGSPASYLGQSSNGAARNAVGARTVSFYPLAATTGTAQGVGIFLNGDNTITVGTSCGTFTVVPAVANFADLGAALTASGITAQIDSKGLLSATAGGKLYSVRADYFMTQTTAIGKASLAIGTDGLLRFTDKDGNVQILRAAFLDTSALQSAMGAALGGVVTTQADGSGVFTRINGVSWALTPEMVLTPASQVQGSGSLINDRANHYLYRIVNFYQGFTATAR